MRRSLAFSLILASATASFACAWDYDTLKMEREHFPGALELIVGKFLRHSDTFYEWRIKDRTASVARHESGGAPLADKDLAAAYDDLAVAYDKLGKHDEAIETIREKAEKLPSVGQYETHANLGTFLVHAGRYEEGLDELRRAIEINPDAHFGREKYQIRLVEYLIEKAGTTGVVALPLDTDVDARAADLGPFGRWLLVEEGLSLSDDREAAEAELGRATKGLLGMMRFGNFRSPILLEALGDLLLAKRDAGKTQGQRLAARAYLRAAEFAGSESAKENYRAMAGMAIFMQHPDKKAGESTSTDAEFENGLIGLSFASLENQLAREVKEADAWFKEVAHDEELWVVASPDPDKRFWEKYGNQTITVGHDRLPAGKFAAAGLPVILRVALGAGLVLTVLVVIAAMVWRKRHPTGYTVKERQAPGGGA